MDEIGWSGGRRRLDREENKKARAKIIKEKKGWPAPPEHQHTEFDKDLVDLFDDLPPNEVPITQNKDVAAAHQKKLQHLKEKDVMPEVKKMIADVIEIQNKICSPWEIKFLADMQKKVDAGEHFSLNQGNKIHELYKKACDSPY